MTSHSPLIGLDPRLVWSGLRTEVIPTTFIESERLNRALQLKPGLLLVSETFQHTGSFKYRAALSVALHSRSSHLLTASSGNFGAALALAASRTGKLCTVVMPAQSAQVKIRAVQSAGATVDLIDTSQITRAGRVEQLRQAHSEAQVVSPYDDPYVVAGNSSLGAELFAREVPDCVVVPVGGGGLSSGLVVARDLLATTCEVVGAEPLLANDGARSLRSGKLCANDQEPSTLCDGARTLSLGKLNFAVLQQGAAEIVEADEGNIARAVRMLFELANLKAEPTGALSLAAVLQSPRRFAGKRVACIVSGGNVDPALYAQLILQN
jgi:threonine dehydratase